MLHVRPTIRLSGAIHVHRPSPTQPWHNHIHHRNLLTLAIETSCDDTAVAILQKDSPSPSNQPSKTSNSSTTRDPANPNPNPNPNPNSNPNSNPTRTQKHQLSRQKARLLFNKRITAPNTGLGGIHPIEALEHHQATLAKLISKAVGYLPDVSASDQNERPGKTINFGDGTVKQLPDFVSVTRGPGMRSNLHCGLNTAKGLATAWQVPLLGVNHMQAHALTPRLVEALEADTQSGSDSDDIAEREPATEFPFLTLLVSGGHTMLLHSQGLTDHKILVPLEDIAIGDALDKSGRMILPEAIKSESKDTAFAKLLSQFAFPDQESYELWPVPRKRMHEIDKPKNAYGWQIQAPFAKSLQMSFSFTSIASTVEQILQKRDQSPRSEVSLEERKLLGRTAIGIAFEHLASRTILALESLRSEKKRVSTLVVSGGVAANPFLRFFLQEVLDVRGFGYVRLVFPPPWLCTDNAAMIAWCGMEMYEAGYRSSLEIDSKKKWSMDSGAPDGGIPGADGWLLAERS